MVCLTINKLVDVSYSVKATIGKYPYWVSGITSALQFFSSPDSGDQSPQDRKGENREFSKVFLEPDRIVRNFDVACFRRSAAAQATTQPTPTMVMPHAETVHRPSPAEIIFIVPATFRQSAISTGNKIIGANDEADKYNYAQNDFHVHQHGREQGCERRRHFCRRPAAGQVKSKWSNKGTISDFTCRKSVLSRS